MTAKKWTAAFFITAAVFALLILALNVLVDPFGVFGDPIFHWDSYSETQNPRIGKIAYLDRYNVRGGYAGRARYGLLYRG